MFVSFLLSLLHIFWVDGKIEELIAPSTQMEFYLKYQVLVLRVIH